jgi:anti-sigma factor (TIGR02949 family)
MDCQQVVERLWDYLDGELTDETMTEIRAHLKACKGCFPHFDFEEAFLEAVRKSREEETCPDELRRKVMAKIRGAMQEA